MYKEWFLIRCGKISLEHEALSMDHPWVNTLTNLWKNNEYSFQYEFVIIFGSSDQIPTQTQSSHMSRDFNTFDCNVGYLPTKCQNFLSDTEQPLFMDKGEEMRFPSLKWVSLPCCISPCSLKPGESIQLLQHLINKITS
jgi:hypothetical protein